MKNKHLLIPLFVIIFACVLGLVLSIIDFKVTNKSLSYSYELIQFNYDGASDGLDPNGDPFNPVDFLTDDVIKDALVESGLENTYEVEKVRECILMENVIPKTIVKEIESYDSKLSSDTRTITSSDYHPVKYRFVLYSDLDKKLSSTALSELLVSIVKAYENHFYEVYKTNFDISHYDDIYSMENYDYIYQVAVFKSKINLLKSSAKGLYDEHTDFVVNGRSFDDIVLKCDQLLTSDVSRINNIITLNALSTDIDRLKDYYEYKIEILNYEKIKNQNDLVSINNQLTNYEKYPTAYVGSGDNIVKVDGNSSETYDALLARKISISDNIASINTEITEYQNILDDINSATGTEDDYTLVTRYITKLGNDYDELEASFDDLADAYNEKYVKDGTVAISKVRYQSNSIVSSSFIVRCIKICAPIVLFALLGCCVYWLGREIKKNKKRYN